MIPLLAVVGFRSRQGRRFQLWLPLFLLWLLVLPLVLVLLPLVLVGFWAVRVNPFRALWTAWQTFCALKNSHVEVENDGAWVLISVV